MSFDLVLKGDEKDVQKAIKALGKSVLKGVHGDSYMGNVYFSSVPLPSSIASPQAYLDRLATTLNRFSVRYMLTTPNNDKARSEYRVMTNAKGEVKVTQKATKRSRLR